MDNASLTLIFILAVIYIKSKTSECILKIILSFVLCWYETSHVTLWEKQFSRVEDKLLRKTYGPKVKRG